MRTKNKTERAKMLDLLSNVPAIKNSGAKLIPFSALTGEGKDELTSAFLSLAVPDRKEND